MKIFLKKWNPRFCTRPQVHARLGLSLARRVRLLVEALESRVVPANIAPGTEGGAAGVLPAVPDNLGFERGLAGWNANSGENGSVAVVTQWVANGGKDPDSGNVAPSQTYNPVEGHNFALLRTANIDSVTTLSHSFQIGQGGQRISFSAFFDAGDHATFNDYGDIVLYEGNTPLVTLFAESILGGNGLNDNPQVPLLAPRLDGSTIRDAVGSYGSTPWSTIEYDITQPGNYSLVARTSNTGDNALDSYLGLDNVQFLGAVTLTANAGSHYDVAGGSSVTLHGFGTTGGNLPLTYTWDLHYNGTTFNPTVSGQNVDFASGGLQGGTTQTVALQVSNGESSVIDTATVTVIDQAAVFGTARPNSSDVGNKFHFNLPFTDPDSSSWTAMVSFGDGSDPQTLTSDMLAGGDVPLNHTYTSKGDYTITVAVTDNQGVTTDSLSLDKTVSSVTATFDVGNPITAQVGNVVDRTVTFTATGLETWNVQVDPLGAGAFAPISFSSLGLVNSIDFNHIYAAPGTYNVTFHIDNGFDPVQTATLLVNVFPAQQYTNLDHNGAQMVTDSALGAQVGVGGTAKDGTSTHVDASLGGDAGASVFAGSYKSDPTTSSSSGGKDIIKVAGSSAASPEAFFDLRAAGVDADSTLTTTFTVEIDPATQNKDDIKLYFHDGNVWQLVQADPNFPITRTVMGTDAGTGKEIVQIQFTATAHSNPSIFDLHGTVFTVALPAPQEAPTTTPVTPPVAGLTAVPAVALSTSFSSDSGGTFVLRVSQGIDLSNSRTEASSTSTSSVTSGHEEDPNPSQVAQAALDNNWLLRAMTHSDDDDDAGNPIRPAFGTDQQNRPAQPAGPESDEIKGSVESEVLDSMFAQSSKDDADAFGGDVDLFGIKADDEDVGESGPGANWALVAAAIGAGQVGFPEEWEREEREME